MARHRRKWTFGYESDGDLSWVVDPKGNTTPDTEDYKTRYTYDAWGQLLTAENANHHTAVNDDFDDNGYPQTIIDAARKSTTFTYDERGQVKTVTDAYQKVTRQNYDTFGRPLDNSVPVKQDENQFIVTPAPKYDANDNVLESYAPNGAVSKAFYDDADQLDYTLAPVDNPGDPERKTSFTYDKVGNVITTTEPKGNLTSTVEGDYVTTNKFNEIYQLESVTNALNQKISYEYDDVGNVRKVIDPRKNISTAVDYTTMFDYDKAHRLITTTDALGKTTSSTYDLDGLVKATTDQLGVTTLIDLDPRGKPFQVKVPHKTVGGTTTYRITQYDYDEVGNQTKVTSPRGMATTDDPDDFATVTDYDELNRVKETRTAYDKDDTRYTTADVTTYLYDDVGRLKTLSAPPSAGQSVGNKTSYTYLDNGWTEASTDPWDIKTSYKYNELGAQTARTIEAAGGSANRTMTWTYYLDGKLRTRTNDGVPVGQQVVLVDNSDFNNTTATGTWTAGTSADTYGHNYFTRPAGTGANTFAWQLNVPQAGTYEVFARYPNASGAATNAKFSVTHGGGTTVKTIDQTADTGSWVSLGSYSFAEGNSKQVTLSDQANGIVVADAVKLVRDNSADPDNEKHDYTYRYDPNGNLTTLTDSSPGARVDSYSVVYTGLNQVQTVTESKSGTVKNTTSFTYNENGLPFTTTHDKQWASYDYDPRDLVSMVTNGKSPTDTDKKTTTFAYTDRKEKLREVKGNGNTVDYTYYLDGLLNTQVETKPNGTLVSDHTYTYDLNGNRTQDVARKMNADNHSAYLNTISDYVYDPRDRLARLTKTGDGADTETYIHDANNNVIDQTIKGTTTTFNYDRNRLLTVSAGGATSSYNYDPFGRLDTVTAAGTVVERNVYDGFDHVIENRKNNGTATSTTKYTYDPLDRTTTKTTDAGGTKEKTTTFNYLGLSKEVLDEEVAGDLTKSYQYSPWGQRLSQVTHNTDGTEEDAYYGYDKHTDVEQLTDDTGDTKATYGYTAYGKNDEAQFTGIDKPDAADPTKVPYNAYRFNAKRWDANSQSYDMGFRDYSPGLNRFLTRDSYNGALSDMKLGLNPFTGNRYAFGGGNPVSMIEHDGHAPFGADDEGGSHGCTSIKECERQAEDNSLFPSWDPPDVGGGPWEEDIPYVLEMAGKTGVDPQLLLANYITESYRCTEAGDAVCGGMQRLQKGVTDPWWALASPLIPILGNLTGQGDDASIGYANFERATFENTRDNHPELAGREWDELITDKRLNIEAMAYRMQDLGAMLPAPLSKSYSNELIRFGYRAGEENMQDVAQGKLPMGAESVANNQMFQKQYARAGRWLSYYYSDQCGSGSCYV